LCFGALQGPAGEIDDRQVERRECNDPRCVTVTTRQGLRLDVTASRPPSGGCDRDPAKLVGALEVRDLVHVFDFDGEIFNGGFTAVTSAGSRRRHHLRRRPRLSSVGCPASRTPVRTVSRRFAVASAATLGASCRVASAARSYGPRTCRSEDARCSPTTCCAFPTSPMTESLHRVEWSAP
jgi:hypothetical protein